MAPDKEALNEETVAEVLEELEDQELIEVLLKRNGSVDEAAIQKDVNERIAHAGSVKAAYEHACAQVDEAMEECLAQVERLATRYEATFTALDMLEDRLKEKAEPEPDAEGEGAEETKAGLN